MGYALIWIEGLAAMLLLIALSASCSARWSRRWRQLVLPVLTALTVSVLGAALTYGAGLLKFRFHGKVPHDWLIYTLSWTISFFVGVWIIFSRGLKRSGAERIPPARSWPRGRLALALSGTAILFAITLSNMDLAMKVQLAEVRAEAGALVLAMNPPPIEEKDNAALIYEEAFAALTPLERLPPRWKQIMETLKRKETNRVFSYSWDIKGDALELFDWRDQELQKFLHSQDQALTLLRKAASKPECRFPQRDPLDFFEGTRRSAPEPQLSHRSQLLNFNAKYRSLRGFAPDSQLSEASQLLALDARVQAAAGNTRTAVEDIAAILGIARHISQARVEDEGWETFGAVLNLASPKPDELSRLPVNEGTPYLRLFPKTQVSFALRTLSMQSPEWASLRFWDLTREAPFLHRKGKSMPVGYEAPWWFEATIGSLWRVFLMPDELMWIHRSLKDCRDFLASPEQQTFADWQELLRSLREQQWGWMYLQYMKFKLEANGFWGCDVTTLRRFSRLAVVLINYRVKHGEYPRTLEELTPTFLDRLPNDPWDGGRLHMKQTEEEVMLFTLRNGTDEPVLSPNMRRGQRRDIVFRLPVR